MKRIIEFFVGNRLFGDLISIFIIGAGIVSAATIQREVFPNVSFDIITIATIYPGASPEEIEKLITNPIEQDLKEVTGIKKLQSISLEGQSRIVAFLDPDQTTEDEAKSDIQDIVDLYEPPEGAEDPVVVAVESKQQPIIEVSISADVPEQELRLIAKDLEIEIEKTKGVAKVVHKGLRDLEVRVEANPQTLKRIGVTLDELITALKQQNQSIPAGTIQATATTSEKIVRTVGDFKSLNDIEETVIRANELGRAIRVKDVAKVYYDLETATVLNRTNGKPSLSLTVLKKESGDAITMVDLTKDLVERYADKFKDKGFEYEFVNDFSYFIRRRVRILSTNLLVGLFLVSLVLAFFLPFRVAMIAVMGIALSFFATIWIFNAAGFTINLISLMGLIIVCGMLVDDAVVVSDNIVRQMEEGNDPETAAIKGANEIWPAVTASILTTVTAFMPMMFMTGIFGKFIKQIPLAVVIALLFSLLEAIWILPQHMAHYVSKKSLEPSPNPRNLKNRFQFFWDKKVVPRYLNIVRGMINIRYIVCGGLFAFFILTLVVAATGLKVSLFPKDGVETFFVRVKAPTGASLEQTLKAVIPVEKEILNLPEEEVINFVTSIGIVQQDANDPNTKRGTEYAQIAVFLTPEPDRNRYADEIINKLKEDVGQPDGIERITFERVNPGPPVGKPVSVAIRGDDYDKINAAIADLKPLLEAVEGVQELDSSFSPGKDEIQLIINRSEAAAAGVSVAQIGSTVRAAFDGIVATTIQELDDEVDVRVSFSKEDRSREEILNSIEIPNRTGNLIPLTQVTAQIRTKGIATYQHEANQREVRLTGEIDDNITDARTVAGIVANELSPQILEKHPEVSIAQGGEDEDTNESFASLISTFTVALMGIILILILTFGNLFQPLLVVMTIPLGVMSVIWTLFFAGKPLSFLAMLGVIALAGVIVNNAIVLIDFVNSGRDRGLDRIESIINAAKLRIRPIFLTSTTTVAGLLPTAHGIGGLDKFVVPIAMSLGYGILFGSLLTAFFFPAAIAVIDDLQQFVYRLHARIKGRPVV